MRYNMHYNMNIISFGPTQPEMVLKSEFDDLKAKQHEDILAIQVNYELVEQEWSGIM